jgi:hypothetical protein
MLVNLEGLSVKVYRNLHKNCFSIVDSKSGLVIGHETKLILLDAEFRIQPAGQRRVRIEKRKNVHAYVKGIYTGWDHPEEELVPLSYNPYQDSYFRTPEGNQVVFSGHVYFMDGRAFIPTMKGSY